MQTTRIIALSLLLPLGAGIAGCSVGEASAPAATTEETAAPVPVETAFAHRGDIYATYQATTTIASDADAPVLAKVGGDVVEILVEEGDQVSKGDVLARLDGERLRLEMLSAKANLERTQGEYERLGDLHERKLVSAASYEGLKYDLDALSATYKLARLNYEYSAIRAPISGVVSSRDVKLGANVTVNQVVFRVTDTRELLAHLQIPQTELAKFAAGHTATLEVDSMRGRRFEATIARISPTIDTRNGTFRATALIDNSGGELAPGMFARFTIAYEKHEDVIIIPADAVLVEDNEASVYVVSGDEVNKRVIETGVRANGRLEVLKGLDGSETVVVVGQSSLREGSKVLASNTVADSSSG
ncbi:MAG: efflux RND transporter periplasmic adaptor subunit [Pseudomonadota bacterium]